MFLLWQSPNVWERIVKLGCFIFGPLPQTPASSDQCQECGPAQAGSFGLLSLISAQQKHSRLFISLSVPHQLISSSVNPFVSPILGLSSPNQNPLKSFCCCFHCFINSFTALIHFITSSCKGIIQPKMKILSLLFHMAPNPHDFVSSVEHKKENCSQHGEETF